MASTDGYAGIACCSRLHSLERVHIVMCPRKCVFREKRSFEIKSNLLRKALTVFTNFDWQDINLSMFDVSYSGPLPAYFQTKYISKPNSLWSLTSHQSEILGRQTSEFVELLRLYIHLNLFNSEGKIRFLARQFPLLHMMSADDVNPLKISRSIAISVILDMYSTFCITWKATRGHRALSKSVFFSPILSLFLFE